ncbi:MAG: GNAT family N-acetyltransferase [Tepidiformaceae bacterium]
MPGSLYRESSTIMKATLARQMGCQPADYESHEVTAVERPADSREPHLVLVTTCGTGSVVSVRDPRLGDWARANAPKPGRNQQIFLPKFLEGMASEARRLGHADARSHSSSGGMVLAEERPPRELPEGFRIRELTGAEVEALRSTLQFDNALGEPDETRRIAAHRIAFAAVDPHGTVVAVTGIWDQYPGIDELGLDVLREHRGAGLAAALTIHAIRWIRSEGRWPIYTHGFTNVRSMNNGLACGFRPLWFLSAVFVPEDMH